MKDSFIETVKEFHKTFNHPILQTPTIPEDRVNLRVSLIAEELEELKQACEEGNIVEVADAFCDLQYVLSGAILEFGMAEKFPELFQETHRSNMSKACKTFEEAKQTIKYWTDQGQPCFWEHDPDNDVYLIYRKSDQKTLKSVHYSPSNLVPILTKK